MNAPLASSLVLFFIFLCCVGYTSGIKVPFIIVGAMVSVLALWVVMALFFVWMGFSIQ